MAATENIAPEEQPIEDSSSVPEAEPDAAEKIEEPPSKPGEDQFYAPPPDHVTGEVDDLAKLTNLNKNTLLSEIKVSMCY